MNSSMLVSVIVVTYNSGKTVQETLNSIFNQTYSNIELIITDDCSCDNTVEICETWLAEHSQRFNTTYLLTAIKNQGVCENANKGRFLAKGEWQIGVAGDDILLSNCISDNILYVQSHPNASFVFSYMKVYQDEFKEEKCVNPKKGPRDPELFEAPINIQLIHMAYAAYVYATSMFVKSSAFKDVGGYSNKYGYEDWPFFIDILEKGYKIDLLDKVTYGYRIHNSQSHTNGKLFNYSLTLQTIPFIKERCFKYYTCKKKNAVKCQWLFEKILFKTHLDNATPLMSFIYRKVVAGLFKFGNTSLNQYRV